MWEIITTSIRDDHGVCDISVSWLDRERQNSDIDVILVFNKDWSAFVKTVS